MLDSLLYKNIFAHFILKPYPQQQFNTQQPGYAPPPVYGETQFQGKIDTFFTLIIKVKDPNNNQQQFGYSVTVTQNPPLSDVFDCAECELIFF